MKAVVLSVMSLCGLLALCTSVQGMEGSIDLLARAALTFPGQLPCDGLDCTCAFKQRDCCCGTKQMTAVEINIFTRMVNLWTALEDLEMKTEAITENTHISFSASMADMSTTSYGPFTTNVPMAYTSVAHNDGYGYNPALGVFTAPTSGVYSFSYTAYSNVEGPGKRLYQHVRLMKNGNVVASTWEDNREDGDDSGSQVVALQLKRGCQVYMELASGRSLSGDYGRYNTFSGYLLYPDVED